MGAVTAAPPYIHIVDPERERVRLAELVAALSLGVDLGFGQPMEHILRQCRIALRTAELAGLDEATRTSIYYSALLVNVGCHTDAHEQAHWFGDDIAFKATKYGPEPFSVADVGARSEAAVVATIGAPGVVKVWTAPTDVPFAFEAIAQTKYVVPGVNPPIASLKAVEVFPAPSGAPAAG